jgi:hypothetical protein
VPPSAGGRASFADRFTLATVVGLIFVVWGTYIGAQLLSDNSLMTHLATGRLILDGGVPTEDPYSFTALGDGWVVQSWLPALAFAALERTFGPGGIHLLVAPLCGVLGGIVWLLTAPARALVIRLSLSLLGLLLGAFLWSERPLLVGLLGIGLVLLVSERRWPAWVLLPYFWLWVNSHGSFPLGLVLLALLWAGSRLDGERGDRERTMLAWAVGGTALGVLSPLGIQVLTFPLQLLGRQEALSGVVEWQSPDFSDFWARVFLIQLMVAVVALVRRPSYRDALPAVVFIAAALVASRNAAVASLVLLPVSARGLAGLGSLTGADLRGKVPAVLSSVLVLLSGVLVWASTTGEGWAFHGYPVAALSWADEQGLVGGDQRLLTQDFVGNFMESTWGTEVPVFMDDRFDMYPQEVLDDYRVLAKGEPGWRGVLERHEIDSVLWGAGEPLAGLLTQDPGWRVVYQDGSWVLFQRR